MAIAPWEVRLLGGMNRFRPSICMKASRNDSKRICECGWGCACLPPRIFGALCQPLFSEISEPIWVPRCSRHWESQWLTLQFQGFAKRPGRGRQSSKVILGSHAMQPNCVRVIQGCPFCLSRKLARLLALVVLLTGRKEAGQQKSNRHLIRFTNVNCG